MCDFGCGKLLVCFTHLVRVLMVVTWATSTTMSSMNALACVLRLVGSCTALVLLASVDTMTVAQLFRSSSGCSSTACMSPNAYHQ